MQEIGAEYGNDIEVVWSAAEDVNPVHMQELRVAMFEYQEKYKEDIEKELNGNQDSTNETDGFDPNK